MSNNCDRASCTWPSCGCGSRTCDADVVNEQASLRDRCAAHLDKLGRTDPTIYGNPIDRLVEFVVSECGRVAHPVLDASTPLCLYFDSEVDREEFVKLIRDVKPGMRAVKL